MNIKQAAEQSGVSSQNIRFYETEGLVVPARRGNGYRDYSAKDVHDLKLIRMLRMLEMPLPQIRQVLQGELALPDAAQTQQILLEQRAQQLAGAIQFCSQLQKNSQSLAALDVDQCLARMQTPDRQGGFFTGWLEDWQAVALAEHEKTFSFIPDTSVQNPQEFTTALEVYAAENGLTLEMLQEGMTPRFLLDGLEYKAACYYGGRIPTAIIRCTANQPQLLDPPIPTRRARLLQAAHRMLLPGAVALGILLLLFLGRPELMKTPDGWIMLGSLAVVLVAMTVRDYFLYYNENGKQGKNKS